MQVQGIANRDRRDASIIRSVDARGVPGMPGHRTDPVPAEGFKPFVGDGLGQEQPPARLLPSRAPILPGITASLAVRPAGLRHARRSAAIDDRPSAGGAEDLLADALGILPGCRVASGGQVDQASRIPCTFPILISGQKCPSLIQCPCSQRALDVPAREARGTLHAKGRRGECLVRRNIRKTKHKAMRYMAAIPVNQIALEPRRKREPDHAKRDVLSLPATERRDSRAQRNEATRHMCRRFSQWSHRLGRRQDLQGHRRAGWR